MVEWYRENGPSVLVKDIIMPEFNSFGLEGYLTMLVGMKVPHLRMYPIPDAELKAWRNRRDAYGVAARKGIDVRECLASLRKSGFMN